MYTRDFTHKLTITDKKGRLVRHVLSRSEDEMKRMRAALYWTLNHRLKLGYSFSSIDLEQEKKAKLEEMIQREREENEKLKGIQAKEEEVEAGVGSIDEQLIKILNEKFSVLQKRLEAVESLGKAVHNPHYKAANNVKKVASK